MRRELRIDKKAIVVVQLAGCVPEVRSPGSWLQHCLTPGMVDLLMPAFMTVMWRQEDPNFKVILRHIDKTSLGYMRPCFLKT